MSKTQKEPNDIRVGFNSRVGSVVSYCENLLKDGKFKSLNFSAVGGSIGTLVIAVEVLKTIYPGLYQLNRLATISYQSVEEGEKKSTENQRLYPKLEVILTLDKPEKTGEGFQDKLSEEDRKKLLDIQTKKRDEMRNRPRGRGGFRGRRGGFRGRRGGFRGRRGGFRGGRAQPFIRRGGRGMPRGGRGRPMQRGMRRGFRGGRGTAPARGGKKF